MNIYDKLKQLSLTESEKPLIDYVIEHSEDIMNMSASDISKNSYVSVSTIYRIIDKLELSGLQAFKSHIHFDRERYQKELVSVDYNYPVRINNTNHEIMTKMLNLYDQTLHSTLNLVNLDEFGKIVQKMYDANVIALFPSIGNFFMAECFRQNMLEIGKDVIVEKQIFYQTKVAETLKKGDLAIVISHANRTPHVEDFIRVMNKNQVTTVLISSTKESELSKLVDYHLYFASYEDSEEKIASFSSRASLQFLLDCLYACYFNKDYEKNIDYRIEHYIELS